LRDAQNRMGNTELGKRKNNLVEEFLRYFDVAIATSATQKQAVYRIRYRVYCEEFQYEPLDAFPDELEIDEFDAQSSHCLITNKSSGIPAGCVRLVSPTRIEGGGQLPLERYCKDSLDSGILDELNRDRTTICEISRLAVDGAFRKRPEEKATRFGEVDGVNLNKREQRTFSVIANVCFLAATALTVIEAKNNVYAMMEPFLPRMLKRSGINCRRAGSDIEYHGVRAPYFITSQSALENMDPDLKELYVEIKSRLE
jgi:N-acyl amino acid synthase of PEP-CTERM/exosortase system